MDEHSQADHRVPSDDDLEEQLISQLAGYEEQLLTPAAMNIETISDGLPDELRRRFTNAQVVLQRLARVRRVELDDTDKPGATPRGTAEPTVPFEIPDVIGRYEILELIAQGGFGIIFRAWDPELHREVALKIPRLGSFASVEMRERFVREARAVAALDHPQVVPVFDVGSEGHLCYIVSAYCPGEDLAEWLRDFDAASPRAAACLIASLANAVHHAHTRGVLHRDLKPSNVLIEQCDHVEELSEDMRVFGGVPRVTDFGLAKLQFDEENATQTGTVLGTASYMAPEQAAGTIHQLGPTADIYSLGAMLYELLTSRPPFIGETAEILQQLQLDGPVPPSRLRGGVPRDLETIVLKCLDKDPRKRYESGQQLAEDLHRWLRGEPVRARRTSAIGRCLRWCRRRPLVASLATALLLVTVIGFAAVVWQWHLAHENFERARRDREKMMLVVDEMLTDIGADRLQTEPQFELVRRELLEDALRIYEQLLRDDDGDVRLGRETARAYQRVGEIRTWLGDFPEAIAALDESIRILRALIRRGAEEPSYRLSLAYGYLALGYAHAELNQLDQALEYYRQAETSYASAPQDIRRTILFQTEIAMLHNRTGYAWLRKGSMDEAERQFKLAALALKAEHQLDSAARAERARSRHLLGEVYSKSSRPAEAVAVFQQAISEQAEIVSERNYPMDRAMLGRMFRGLAQILSNSGEVQEALNAYRQSLDTFEQLAADYPQVTVYQVQAATAHANLGWSFNEHNNQEGRAHRIHQGSYDSP